MNVSVTNIFTQNYKCKNPVIVNVGGARSSKSYSIAQILIQKLCNERNKNIGICRKTLVSNKATSYRLFINLLKEYGRYFSFAHNKSENYYELNNNRVTFFGLDDPEKIKSSEYNYLWLEEANEFTYDDFIVLQTRMSGKKLSHEHNQIYLSLNPVNEFCWVKTELEKDKDIKFINSNYKDNPFLDKDYINYLKGLKNKNNTAYKVYTLGEWSTLKGLIYENYDIVIENNWPKSFDDIIYGMDFGYNNPSAVIFCGIKDNEVYLKQIIYQSGLTNNNLCGKLKTLIPDFGNYNFLADESEPDRIKEFEDNGFCISGAPKGKNSVKDGIDLIKTLKLHIHEESVDLLKEIGGYVWQEDRRNSKLLLDEPVKFNDHILDAMRYALYTYFKDKISEPRISIG